MTFSNPFAVEPTCGDCGRKILHVGYVSFIERSAMGIVNGTKLHVRICPTCDLLPLWPRENK